MTKLRQQMIGLLQLRNYSETTIHSYVHIVERFARHFHKSPDALGCEEVKQFLLHLRNEKKVKWPTLQINRAALRFLYVRVLKQKWFEEEIPPPKRRPYLPTVLSAEEITRMLDLTTNLKHWTIMAVFASPCKRSTAGCKPFSATCRSFIRVRLPSSTLCPSIVAATPRPVIDRKPCGSRNRSSEPTRSSASGTWRGSSGCCKAGDTWPTSACCIPSRRCRPAITLMAR